jgi:hypothetical protein
MIHSQLTRRDAKNFSSVRWSDASTSVSKRPPIWLATQRMTFTSDAVSKARISSFNPCLVKQAVVCAAKYNGMFYPGKQEVSQMNYE